MNVNLNMVDTFYHRLDEQTDECASYLYTRHYNFNLSIRYTVSSFIYASPSSPAEDISCASLPRLLRGQKGNRDPQVPQVMGRPLSG
jgi:hypothetical protein